MQICNIISYFNGPFFCSLYQPPPSLQITRYQNSIIFIVYLKQQYHFLTLAPLTRKIQVDMSGYPPMPPSVVELLTDAIGTQRLAPVQDREVIVEEMNLIQQEVNRKSLSEVVAQTFEQKSQTNRDIYDQELKIIKADAIAATSFSELTQQSDDNKIQQHARQLTRNKQSLWQLLEESIASIKKKDPLLDMLLSHKIKPPRNRSLDMSRSQNVSSLYQRMRIARVKSEYGLERQTSLYKNIQKRLGNIEELRLKREREGQEQIIDRTEKQIERQFTIAKIRKVLGGEKRGEGGGRSRLLTIDNQQSLSIFDRASSKMSDVSFQQKKPIAKTEINTISFDQPQIATLKEAYESKFDLVQIYPLQNQQMNDFLWTPDYDSNVDYSRFKRSKGLKVKTNEDKYKKIFQTFYKSSTESQQSNKIPLQTQIPQQDKQSFMITQGDESLFDSQHKHSRNNSQEGLSKILYFQKSFNQSKLRQTLLQKKQAQREKEEQDLVYQELVIEEKRRLRDEERSKSKEAPEDRKSEIATTVKRAINERIRGMRKYDLEAYQRDANLDENYLKYKEERESRNATIFAQQVQTQDERFRTNPLFKKQYVKRDKFLDRVFNQAQGKTDFSFKDTLYQTLNNESPYRQAFLSQPDSRKNDTNQPSEQQQKQFENIPKQNQLDVKQFITLNSQSSQINASARQAFESEVSNCPRQKEVVNNMRQEYIQIQR